MLGEDFWETKSYKNYIQEGRCLILFDGFYEPHTIGKKKASLLILKQCKLK